MALLNPAMLAGLALVAVPVILHLLMRAKPKKLVFPALRLIQNRRRTNVRRLRLRHWLLLLLRMLVLALLAIALARPSLPAADYSLSLGDWLRLAIVGVVVAGVYAGCVWAWRRSRAPDHVRRYRQSVLRSGLGVIGLVLFLVLFAWPYGRRIAASVTQPTVTVNAFMPVAAALVIDDSLSMGYQFESKTRLDVARQIAAEHLARLPRGSRIALAETSSDQPVRFQSDLGGAQSRLDDLRPQPVARPIDERIEAALEAQQEERRRAEEARGRGGDDLLREVYVFTDLASSAWRRDESPRLTQLLAELPDVNVYLIDVGLENVVNFSLANVVLSVPVVTSGGELSLRATVQGQGVPSAERVVEVYLEDDSGTLAKQGQATTRVEAGAEAAVQFPLRGFSGSVRQGELRLLSSDPLSFDDVRYFSVQVRPPQELLVITDSAASAQYLVEALAPEELVKLGKARYRITVAASGKLATESLEKYAAVMLVNVADPGFAGWEAMASYVEAGGGLAVVLGSRVQHAAYLSKAAEQVLPGALKARFTFRPAETLDLQRNTHPLFRRFQDWGFGDLISAEIQQYWQVEPVEGGGVIARFTNVRQSPAVLERGIGQGRVLMWTTALERGGWNDLPAAGWSFVALADQMVQYLTREGNERLMFVAGEPVVIALGERKEAGAPPVEEPWLLRKPERQQVRLEVDPGVRSLTLTDMEQLGNYRVLEPDGEASRERGFSINAVPAESQLARETAEQLDARLGKGRYSLARNIEGLRREVQSGRIGQEVFPWLLAVLLVIFVAEHTVANRFYDPAPETPAA